MLNKILVVSCITLMFPNLNEAQFCKDGEVRLVKDINTEVDPYGLRNNGIIHEGIFFYSFDDGMHGDELWVSDGTSIGTRLLSDITPGPHDSSPNHLTIVNDYLFFSARTEDSRRQLLYINLNDPSYQVIVEDITSGGDWDADPIFLTPYGDTLVFVADGTDGDREIWYIDTQSLTATSLGSQMNTGESVISVFDASYPAPIFFSARSQSRFSEQNLWKYDNGTISLVKEMGERFLSTLTAIINDQFFFSFETDTTGIELWVSDGTELGTFQLMDINPGTADSDPQSFYVMDDKLYFRANNPTYGDELWITDGTTAGTMMVKDISTGTSRSSPTPLFDDGDNYYFTALDNNIIKIYLTDGTEAGTKIWAEFDYSDVHYVNRTEHSLNGSPLIAVGIDNKLDFYTISSNGGIEQISDMEAGIFENTSCGTCVKSVSNGRIKFIKKNTSTGVELWEYNIEKNTLELYEFYSGSDDGIGRNDYYHSTSIDYFFAVSEDDGKELYINIDEPISIGEKSTLRAPTEDSYPRSLVSIPNLNLLAFDASDQDDSHIWITDGTEAGTRIILDTYTSGDMIAYDNGILFLDNNNQWQYYDVTQEQLSSYGPPLPEYPSNRSAIGEELFFTMSDQLYSLNNQGDTTNLTYNTGELSTLSISYNNHHGSTYIFRGLPDNRRIITSYEGGTETVLLDLTGFYQTFYLGPYLYVWVYNSLTAERVIYRSDGSSTGTIEILSTANPEYHSLSPITDDGRHLLLYVGNDSNSNGEIFTNGDFIIVDGYNGVVSAPDISDIPFDVRDITESDWGLIIEINNDSLVRYNPITQDSITIEDYNNDQLYWNGHVLYSTDQSTHKKLKLISPLNESMVLLHLPDESYEPNIDPSSSVIMGDKLYFSYEDRVTGEELYVIDCSCSDEVDIRSNRIQPGSYTIDNTIELQGSTIYDTELQIYAGEEITLNPGFEVANRTIMELTTGGVIDRCPSESGAGE